MRQSETTGRTDDKSTSLSNYRHLAAGSDIDLRDNAS